MSRYYDPKTASFLSRDSVQYLAPKISGGLDLYAYCYNNPVSGQLFTKAVFMGIAATKAFAIGALIYDFLVFVIAPLIYLAIEGIELGSSQVNLPNVQPTPPHPADR